MSMSTHVMGFKPPDAKWHMMKAVYDACIAAGLSVPSEVSAFFGHDAPDPAGVTVSQDALQKCGAVKRYQAEMEDGFDIDIKKLPPDVTVVRVVNSY